MIRASDVAKRKASHITRSTAETLVYLTSKTKSVEEAADIFESFGNVSLCVLFFVVAYIE
jgi:hypothetical protein